MPQGVTVLDDSQPTGVASAPATPPPQTASAPGVYDFGPGSEAARAVEADQNPFRPSTEGKQTGVAGAVAGVGDLLPSTDPLHYFSGPAYLIRHPIEGMKLLTEAFAEGQTGLWKGSNQAWQQYKDAFSKGNYGEALDHLIDSYRQGVEAFVPGVGPGMEAGVQRVRDGETIRGLIDMIGGAGLAMLGTKARAPAVTGATESQLSRLGITPTLAERYESPTLATIDPQMSRMMGAKEIAQPFLERRQAEVKAAVGQVGTGISPKAPADVSASLSGAAERERGTIALQERSRVQQQAAAPTVPYEQAENLTNRALRGEENALRQHESQAWQGLEQRAAEANVQVGVAPLGNLLRPLAALHKSAHDLIMSQMSPRMLSLMARGAAAGGEDGNRIARSLGYRTLDELRNDNPDVYTAITQASARSGTSLETVPFGVAKQARSGIGQLLSKHRTDLLRTADGRAAVGYLNRIYGTLTQAMRDSFQNNPVGVPRAAWEQAFDEANGITRDVNRRFMTPKLVRSIVLNAPENDEGLKGLYAQTLGAKTVSDRLAVVRALQRSPEALATYRGGLVDYILSQSETERGAQGAQFGPRPDFDRALSMLDERRYPGIRRAIGETQYDNLIQALRRMKRSSTSPETVRYLGFLHRLYGPNANVDSVIGKIAADPGVADMAERLARHEPWLSDDIAASIFWKAVDDSTKEGRRGLYIDSNVLRNKLRASRDSIVRFAGESKTAPVDDLADALDKLSLPTGTLEGEAQGFMKYAQLYSLLRGTVDAMTGNLKAAFYNGAFTVAPGTYIRIALSGKSAPLLRGAAETAGRAALFGKAAIKASQFVPNARRTPVAPVTPESAPAIPAGARMYTVTGPDGSTDRLWLTPEEAEQGKKENYQIAPVAQ